MFRHLPALLALLLSTSLLYAHESFAPIVKSEREKVVHISTSSTLPANKDPMIERFFGPQPERRSNALGSGFVYSSDGYIVTNNHVIERAEKIEVTLFNNKSYQALVIGTDPMTDLALIKIEDAPRLKAADLGDSDKLEVGDWVLAIGNPLGLDYTVTAGIISAKGRDIFGGTAYGQFLQTDAAINPGNSGGPLFNVDGEVVGINTAIAQGQGLGFAIPINLAKNILSQLKLHGKVERGWLGVNIQDMNADLAEAFGLPKDLQGVVVTAVGPGSPAEKGGLKQGDVITKFNDQITDKTTRLQQLVAEALPGSQVKMRIYRDRRQLDLAFSLGRRPEGELVNLNDQLNELGFRAVEIDAEVRRQWKIEDHAGLLVVAVDPNAVAYEKGLRRGDILTEADGIPLNKHTDLNRAIEQSRGKLRLLVQRDGQPIFLALPTKP
ncbi:MAG: Do family serine endopeptidase [bacterium]|nr:Do family serine endopeptidase [bacterium]